MKRLFVILFIFTATVSIAQPVRLHLLGGFSNYNGDLQQKRFTLQQAKGAVGIGGTINITDRLSVRSDAMFGYIGADDKRSKNPGLFARNLNFTSKIYELSLLGEYTLYNLNERKFSPYVFGGIGVFHFSPYTTDATGQIIFLADFSTEGQGIIPGKKKYKTTDINVPIGGGIKYALSDDIQVGFELGLRILKTDYLDDVSNAYVDRDVLLAGAGQKAVEMAFRGDELKENPTTYPAAGTLRGNNKVNDFYYFGLFRIDFRLNWFDNLRSGRGSRKGLNCPKVL